VPGPRGLLWQGSYAQSEESEDGFNDAEEAVGAATSRIGVCGDYFRPDNEGTVIGRRGRNLLFLGMVWACSPAFANLVFNPGFELGSTGWTTNTNLSGGADWNITNVGVFGGDSTNGAYAHSGTWFAQDGCNASGHTPNSSCVEPYPDPQGSWLYQDLSTVAGHTYSLTFWFVSDGNNMELEALFGSTVAIDITSIPTSLNDVYQQYSNTVTLTANSSTTRLQFLDYQGPHWASLDDIDVEDLGAAGAPEPGSVVLVGLGLLCLARLKRRG
jgi:hypothetical protein